ncbi:MAG: response regulator, partial [Bacteroidota bacterium]
MNEKLIYIVDDEEALRTLLGHWVTKKWGHSARIFNDAESCLQYLDENPSLVLLDLMLPGMDGVEALKEIKRRVPALPVIMLSAQGKIDLAIDTLRLGATDYFSKPIDFPKLEAAVKNALHIYELEGEVQRLREQAVRRIQFDDIVSGSGDMQEVFRLIEKVKE